jgi:hypothetical protein
VIPSAETAPEFVKAVINEPGRKGVGKAMRILLPFLEIGPPTLQRRIHGLMRALSKRHALSLLALHKPVDPIDEWRQRIRGLYPDTELFVQPAFGLQARAKRTAQLRSLPDATRALPHEECYCSHQSLGRLPTQRATRRLRSPFAGPKVLGR